MLAFCNLWFDFFVVHFDECIILVLALQYEKDEIPTILTGYIS